MITPMEIQNHEFRMQMRGYEKEAVKHFLYAVAEDFEAMIEQNHKMAQELAILRERIKDMESRDKVLKDTLITAQQVKKDIHESAEKEAELIVREAHLKADKIHENAKEQVNHVLEQLVDVRRVRDDLLAEAEMMVSRFGHFVEAERGLATESDKIQRFTSRKKKSAKPDRTIRDVPEPKRVIKEIRSGS